MAFHNRPRFPQHNYNSGYNRNEFRGEPGPRNCPPMMRNFNEGGRMPMPRFPSGGPHMGGSPFAGRVQYPLPSDHMRGPPAFRDPLPNDHMRGPPAFRGRPMMNNRMPPPVFNQPFHDSGFFRPPCPTPPQRMRFPGMPNERFFVPWNQRPKAFFADRPPMRHGPRQNAISPKKPDRKTNEDKPKKKKNKKRKYTPRPRDDSKKLKPWMTDEIYEEVKKKNEMYVKCKNADNPELWQEFRVLRNRVSSLVKDAKLKGGFMTRKQKEEDNVERNFSCDTCDRAFVEESELTEHYKEHIKCDFAECTFDAHPKVVEAHKKMQHETGYADAIKNLSTAEDIEKWRNERKCHYPTAENIRKRQEEQQEKIARGEIVVTKEFGSETKELNGTMTEITEVKQEEGDPSPEAGQE